jgi:hypothetical protein
VDWNALSAIATTVLTAVLVVGGAVAIYQFREARRAAQFDATQRMIDRMLEPDFNRALRYVIDHLPIRMSDPEYTAELESSRGWDVDPERHPELIVLARLEEIGIYLRHRLLLGDALLDVNAALILQSWEHLEESFMLCVSRTATRASGVTRSISTGVPKQYDTAPDRNRHKAHAGRTHYC